MMHPKYESDVASIEASSSSPASPKRAVYYVQSPSRDSHSDPDKSSVQATPSFHSPTDSPSHPSSFDRHSRSSSASRLSGNWRWVTRGHRRSGKGWQDYRRSGKGWQGCNVIDEEADYDIDDEGYSKRFKYFLSVLVLGAIFGLFCLIIWGASRPYKPHISMKSLKIHSFHHWQGADHTGVPTELISLNCSVHMAIHNPATFFGIHVNADPVNLIYFELPVATGKLKEHYQPRKSERILAVNMYGDGVTLYGAGDAFAGVANKGNIPMKLDFKLQSQGDVVGKLVKTTHQLHIYCTLIIDFRSRKEAEFEGDSCTFD
ncbi:hypothetical protein Leryth_018507 [Lithospermum erythrorhizon]|nr:hypothetical protein Leryth_018507 [Lithospermum erythrorhizon]